MALSYSASAQICHVGPTGLFYVGENALVYNGGGVQTKDDGKYDIHGNVMVVGTSSDVFKTINSSGGNFILRLNTPGSYATSTYGQLFINGLAQVNITGVVDKEYRTTKHGTYQQVAIPFYNYTISNLSGSASTIGTLGKTFTNIRYSKNEVLTWNNATAVSDNLSVSSLTPKNTTYYMLGSSGLNTSTPPSTMPANYPKAAGEVFTLRGVPYANGISEKLLNAANGVNFGTGGYGKNYYNEYYNSYLQDDWDYPVNTSNPWSVATFGKNIYQYGNPYFTNLDLTHIGYNEAALGAITDNNVLTSIQGIRIDPGTVISDNTGTYSTGARFLNFTDSYGSTINPSPVGDIGFLVKPMQTFVIKLRGNSAENTGVPGSTNGDRTLSFDEMRRFSYSPRTTGSASVTTAKGSTTNGTVKQLGVIALDAAGNEMARTYYAVYPTAISGHTTQPNVQSVLGSQNIIGTYEEDAMNGGYDMNYINSYWLYINEANETDFFGKAVPLALYNNNIKSLKFEIRENINLIPDGTHKLSTGIGFYYKASNGEIMEISQNQVIPVTSDECSLYYGKTTGTLGTGTTQKPSRTMVVYNGATDSFFVRFDPHWKKADVKVYDMSGKLIISQDNVLTEKDFVLDLAKINNAYIVTATSENGQRMSSKIIR